ncbi:MAG: hypothetical protein IJ496_07970 [Ruminococcus sp.]|nr:hypothetical protein [Ruminococcus sp.]
MEANVYILECLSNLHMGSGDVNYSVIDLEVQRDAVSGEPTMNASGVKGAIRDFCVKSGMKEDDIVRIFGGKDKDKKDVQGSCQFFSGDLLARPVRVSEGVDSYALATTRELIEDFLNKLSAFGYRDLFGENDIPDLKDKVICGRPNTFVEGEQAEKGESKLLSAILGTDKWALMNPQQLQAIDLPTQAHNVLENGQSKNLWYEEYVPHKSIFGLLVVSPDAVLDAAINNRVIQFGAGFSTGNGFMKLTKYLKEV